jgi:hypothetical protein
LRPFQSIFQGRIHDAPFFMRVVTVGGGVSPPASRDLIFTTKGTKGTKEIQENFVIARSFAFHATANPACVAGSVSLAPAFAAYQ